MSDNLPEVWGQLPVVTEGLGRLSQGGLSNDEKQALVLRLRRWLLGVYRLSQTGLTWPIPAGDKRWALFDASVDAMTPVDMILWLLEQDRPIDSERAMFVMRIGLVLRLLADLRGLPS